MSKNILIISNDRLFIKGNKISSDYNDTINIIEGLAKNNNLSFYCRTTNFLKNYLSKKKKYNKFQKFKFFNLTKITNYKIFMISITPFNFLTLIFIKTFNKNINGFVYLRSDGYKEYYHKYGIFGYVVYGFMFKIVTFYLKIITVSKNMTGLKKKYFIVNPSEIEKKWFLNRKKHAEATPETPKRLGRALYDWLGGDDGDLNLTRGEVVTITDVLPGYGWWSGAIDSETGIFPRCYVSLHKAVSSSKYVL